jgi:hypothetical protein
MAISFRNTPQAAIALGLPLVRATASAAERAAITIVYRLYGER